MPIKESKKRVRRNMYRKHAVYEAQPEVGSRAYRQGEIELSKVTVNGLEFDAREKDMDRMNRVVSTANWQYSRLIASGTSANNAYEQVYRQTTIGWKTTDNVFHDITVEVICEVQEKALTRMAEVWARHG